VNKEVEDSNVGGHEACVFYVKNIVTADLGRTDCLAA